MASNIFIEISIILVLAAVFAAIMKILKQPTIIGYILTGIIVSPFFLNLIKSQDMLVVFSQIGVAFLLFIVGLSLNPKVIKEVGKASLITGVGQVVFTSLIGFFIARVFGFDTITSLYIAVALTFSSTIIIMKLLSDKGDLDKLYGKISIGFLLVQDLIAVFILIVVSSFSGPNQALNSILLLLIKGGLIVLLLVLISLYVLPKLGFFFARSQELLFMFSVAWGLGLASLFYLVGLSLEIGALLAGITLSLSPYNNEISSKMKPLRDFFIVLFFIVLGSQLIFDNFSRFLVPTIVFSLFILVGNPLIVMILMGALGYTKKTGLQAGFTVAQISEFSLILIALGVNVGHLTKEILSLVTVIGLATIIGSTYLILYSDKIYPLLEKYLSIFERKSVKKDKKMKSYDVILFGYNRIGFDFVNSFKKLRKKFLVVDYNPEVISNLLKEKIECEYGDVEDIEFLEQLNLKDAKMCISTIPDFETNTLLIGAIRKVNKKAVIMCVSHHIDDAYKLYSKGANYVIMPHFLGGKYASMMIDRYGFNLERFDEEKKKHINHLKKRKELGHNHPEVEKNR
ncbi:cation:proton antiporter [Candidatus Woesearchaeota archaeon]|nr:cation:proton antiporter [Candidatus Woesearchaeota archaeon]